MGFLQPQPFASFFSALSLYTGFGVGSGGRKKRRGRLSFGFFWFPPVKAFWRIAFSFSRDAVAIFRRKKEQPRFFFSFFQRRMVKLWGFCFDRPFQGFCKTRNRDGCVWGGEKKPKSAELVLGFSGLSLTEPVEAFFDFVGRDIFLSGVGLAAGFFCWRLRKGWAS